MPLLLLGLRIQIIKTFEDPNGKVRFARIEIKHLPFCLKVILNQIIHLKYVLLTQGSQKNAFPQIASLSLNFLIITGVQL